MTSAALSALPGWASRALAAAALPDLIERNDWPEHWETTVAGLGRDPVTATERFFVRSHFPVPTVDAATWKLEIAGLVRTPLSLTLDQLRAIAPATVACVLECAGNGRGLLELPSTSGTQWEYGALDAKVAAGALSDV